MMRGGLIVLGIKLKTSYVVGIDFNYLPDPFTFFSKMYFPLYLHAKPSDAEG